MVTTTGPLTFPVTFDGCFGWLHPAAGRRGVVLCGPHGWEMLAAHHAWRDLARGLAALGLPTLRFDYHGTGDALGDDGDPLRVEAWLASIEAAAHCLRERTGVHEVVLVGLRLGALLATLAAGRIPDVAGLALLAPVIGGRTYVREFRTLGLLREGRAPCRRRRTGRSRAAAFI